MQLETKITIEEGDFDVDDCGFGDGSKSVSINQCLTDEQAHQLKDQILENQAVSERVDETIQWVDDQIKGLKRTFDATDDNERYVNFEWLKSHLMSIKLDENRSEL